MNKSLLSNNSKQKLLMILTQHQGRAFSLKELRLRSGISEQKIKTHLNCFLKQRLLVQSEKKRQKYYQINRFCTAFDELVKIFTNTEESKKKDLIEKVITQTGKVKFAALSGIFVGLPKQEVDLLLVGIIGPTKIKRCINFLEKLTGNEINFAVLTEKEFKERFYGFDWFMKEVMDNDPVIIVDEITKRLEKKAGEKILPKVAFKN